MLKLKLRRAVVLLILFHALLVPFMLPISHELKRNVLIGHMGSRLHILLFIPITLLLFRFGPSAGRLVWTAVASAGVGIGIEITQQLVGRHCRLDDFCLDLFGIGLACSWLYWRRTRNRWGPLAAIILVIGILALSHEIPGRALGQRTVRNRFPLLSDFETRWESHIWGPKSIRKLEVVDDDSRHGRCLRVECQPATHYRGTEMSKFPHDWREYASLAGELRAEVCRGDSLSVLILLQDYQGYLQADCAVDTLMVGRKWTPFKLNLESLLTLEAGRPLDLDDLHSLVFYLDAPSDTTVFRIDNIRLED